MEKRAISKARKLYRATGTTSPFSIAERKGYVVIRKTMPAELKGFTTKLYRIPIIYINDMYPQEDQEFTCLHEIGHIICGHEDNTIFLLNHTSQVIGKFENEANDFACTMKLLPYNPIELQGLTIDQIASLVGVRRKTLLNFFNRTRTYV